MFLFFNFDGRNLKVPYTNDRFLLQVKVKVKFTLEQATKAHKGRRGIALFFL
jgi:hypothetical protein